MRTDLLFCLTRDKPLGKRQDKLLATLYDKKRYVIYYRNQQQCTRLYSKDSPRIAILAISMLRNYIELNTNFRTLIKNDFEKNLYKLMNSVIFGKTMKNVRNHVNVRLLTRWEGRYDAEVMIAQPNFHSCNLIAKNA